MNKLKQLDKYLVTLFIPNIDLFLKQLSSQKTDVFKIRSKTRFLKCDSNFHYFADSHDFHNLHDIKLKTFIKEKKFFENFYFRFIFDHEFQVLQIISIIVPMTLYSTPRGKFWKFTLIDPSEPAKRYCINVNMQTANSD
ncbi:hypothetical protein BpHYR1_030123 [Brachionus plicatilis]|uniref:Uncharacterized protein n=1 Tax=Brachionus plicatilis TaxID=10195 RepID=A0A3M7RLZ5_BRAPC|nr:hypothetical protein BpHYR1_030123 [Brachionus plicatilis]